MRSLIASIFRQLFKVPFFRKRFYGLHKRVFYPYKLFQGVIKKANYFGVQFKLHIDDWIQENIYFVQDYECAELLFIQNTLKADDVFVDIGANIGVHSMMASEIISDKGKVISFEASQHNFLRLQEHITLNQANNIEAHHLAVAECNKDITLFYNEEEGNKGMVSAYGKHKSHSEKIKAVALDSFLAQTKIDFIKIDIEGGEFDALKGMKNILQTQNPVLLIELEEDIIEQTDYEEKDIIDFLAQLGYARNYLSDHGTLIAKNENPARKNYIFLKTHTTP